MQGGEKNKVNMCGWRVREEMRGGGKKRVHLININIHTHTHTLPQNWPHHTPPPHCIQNSLRSYYPPHNPSLFDRVWTFHHLEVGGGGPIIGGGGGG